MSHGVLFAVPSWLERCSPCLCNLQNLFVTVQRTNPPDKPYHPWVNASPQFYNWIITKFILPAVVFSQHAMQLTYPSKFHSKPGERLKIIAFHAVPVLIMSFCFACTDTIDAYFPVAGKTLRWGGDFSSWPNWFISVCALLHSGVVALGFVFTMERRVWMVHVFFLYCVIGTLAVTEGNVMLGSKWCTYCLVYSGVYLADPLWAGDLPRYKGDAMKLE